MGVWMSVLVLWSGAAQAQDPWKDPPEEEPPKEPGNEKPIIVDTLEDYEQLLAMLEGEEPPNGPIFQLVEGSTQILAPIDDKQPGKLVPAGEILTNVTTDSNGKKHYIESWLAFRPDQVLAGTQRLEFQGMVLGGFPGVLAEYAALPNAWEYSWLEFRFDYWAPPKAEYIANLPDVVPAFVTDVVRFSVTTDRAGVEEESGALYRERSVVTGDVIWRDVWILWDNYVFPDDVNGVVTRLDAVVVPTQTVKVFLQQQAAEHQWLFVHTKSPIKAVL